MILTNKREQYNVEHSIGENKAAGSFTVTATKKITDMNANITGANSASLGYINYSEDETGNVNRNMNMVPIDKQVVLTALIDEMIKLIKVEINKV